MKRIVVCIMIFTMTLSVSVSAISEDALQQENRSSEQISNELNNKELAVENADNLTELEKITAYPGYKSITLKWQPLEGISKYNIYRSESKSGKFKLIKGNLSGDAYRDKKSIKKNTKYYYKVCPISGDAQEDKLEFAKIVSAKSVRNMYIKIKFKTGVTLSTHDSKKKKSTHFYGGQTVTAEGFGSGKYKFYYKDRLYYVSYIRIKAGSKAEYLRKENYTKLTATNFVNECGQASNTKYLIWVSTYTQHMYIFKGKKGKWKLIKNWEVSTGKGDSPSPVGFNKKIHTKIRRRSSLDYWNCFQSMNSIHGKRSSWKIGSPRSHGCVRNYNDNAKWIYNNVPLNTAVIIF